MKNRLLKINIEKTLGIIFFLFLCSLSISCSNSVMNENNDIKTEITEVKKNEFKNQIKSKEKKVEKNNETVKGEPKNQIKSKDKKATNKSETKKIIPVATEVTDSEFSWSDEPLFDEQKKEVEKNDETSVNLEVKDTKETGTKLVSPENTNEGTAQKLMEDGKTVHIVNISMGSKMFTPSKITINQGDVVRWINNDESIDSHIFKSLPGSNPYDKEKDEIELVKLYSNKTYQQTFERIGQFPYFCFIHKKMSGVITVVKPGQSLSEMKKELKILTEKKKRFKKGSRNLLDAKEMIKIPAGKFIMGSPEVAIDGPVHVVDLPEYYIDKYEVTNEEFEEFSDSTGYEAKGDWRSFYFEGKEKDPVVSIMYGDVLAYADWAGKRIPSESEWEKAARGSDRRLWPWGDDYDNEITNVFGPDEFTGTAPVGSFEEDVSPFGVFDMGGNVSEWTSSPFLPYEGSKTRHPDFSNKKATVRGGSYNTVHDIESRTHSRTGRRPNVPATSVGFRLVR